jgi:sugar phosphate isomerase/epimerase
MSHRRLGRSDLVLSHFSLPLTTPFPDRVEAAAEAGFAGIGWYVADYVRHLDQGWTDDRLLGMLRDHDVMLHEVDAIRLDRLDLLEPAIHLATLVGAHHLQMQGDRPGTVDEAVTVITTVADRLAPEDVGVAIEFVGNTNVRTATDALELAERTGRDNVGVQVDVWHHVRGADDWSLLDRLPLERIASVQLDDGPIEPIDADYRIDTVRHRCVPGEGEFDLARFLATVHPQASTLPLSIEVIDDDLMQLQPSVAARRIAEATRTLVDSLA